MTTLTATETTAPARTRARVSAGSLLKTEWISLSTLRAGKAALAVGLFLVIAPAAGFAALYGWDYSSAGAPAEMLEWMPTIGSLGTNGFIFAAAVAVIVGAGAYAKEHQTGSLRAQLAASPARIGMFTAKAAVVGATVFAFSVIAFAAAIGAAWAGYSLFGVAAPMGEIGTDLVLPVLGASLSAALVAIFSLGLAGILRSETWSVTFAMVFLYVVPIILMQLPWEWALTVSELLLGSTMQTLAMPHAEVTGDVVRDIALTVAWAAAAFVGGAAVVSRRDA